MANYQIIKRLKILIHILNHFPNLGKQEIMRRLEEDYQISITSRTLERDFTALEIDFGIEIQYNRNQNGYSINKEDSLQVIDFLRFAGRIYLGDLLRESLKDFQHLEEIIKLEDFSDYKGVEQIKPLLLAIKNHHWITFKHENFQKERSTVYRIYPLQLREYQGRWYVVGVPKNENHIKTFGLARISGLKPSGGSKILPTKFQQQLEKFDQIVGLNYDASEKQEWIEILVSKEQYKYLRTLPLHATQTLEKTYSHGKVKISLYLIPNYELKMQLLKMGNQIEVLSPPSFREEMITLITKTLKNYENGTKET